MATLTVDRDAMTYTVIEPGRTKKVLSLAYDPDYISDQMCHKIELLEGSISNGAFYGECFLGDEYNAQVLVEIDEGFAACSDHGMMLIKQSV